MDSFWSKLLILGIVAAIGVFFINSVYTPQRSAQEAMAVSTQQSVNAVKAGVADSGPTIVSSTDVINTINSFCKEGNAITYSIENKSIGDYSFTNSNISGTTEVTKAVVSGSFYVKMGSITTGSIRFIEQ